MTNEKSPKIHQLSFHRKVIITHTNILYSLQIKIMKPSNFYFLAFGLMFCSNAVLAQSSKIARAKQYKKDLNYIEAIEILQPLAAKGDNPEAKIELAECYLKVSDVVNAELMYAQVVKLPTAQPVHYLHYGQMLQRNGKCDMAKDWYAKFTEAAPEDVRGQHLSKACENEAELKTKGDGIYEVVAAGFNSRLDDFGPAFYKDGNREGIVFASERDKGVIVKRNHSWTGNPFLDLYFVPAKKNGSKMVYGRPEKFASDINSKYHDAIVTFSKDKQLVYFTRNNYTQGKLGKDDGGTMKLKIYSAQKGKGATSWGNEMELPFNSDQYSCAHPALSADGTKLFFASDMPSGYGGMDLYVSEKENGKWGAPVNLGPSVNTEGNELFPYVQSNGRLYFSSDGQLGLGGLDIFYVDEKGANQWTTPENIGGPINSKDDDFSITFNEDGTAGFFSSDRQGGAGRDDIYSFTKTAMPVQIFVFDEETKEPIENAVVTSDSCNRAEYKTNKNGRVSIDMKFGTCCTFKADKVTYEPNSKEGCVKAANEKSEDIVEIPLRKQLKFIMEGVAYDQVLGTPLDSVIVTLTSDCAGDSTQTLVTDASGKFAFALKRDCCYKVKGEKVKFLAATAEGDSLCTKGLKESKTLQVVLNLQPINAPVSGGTVPPKPAVITDRAKPPYLDAAKNIYVNPVTEKPAQGTINGVNYSDGKIVDAPKQTTTPPKGTQVFPPSNTNHEDGKQAYLLHIYYDFDQSFIREESHSELEKLLKMLKENPTYIIELASHTDSRGSNAYNNRLSQRRAESVVRWLVEKGIERDRLVPRGYGENMNVNKCANNIPCSEQEHQMNRRTEFRVIGCKGCMESEKSKISTPNQNTKVDACKGCPF
jgi:outer membrane protein OmpA-like peptidoglycan-associated protein/tetratricopeptide (TPR) repeat protein